MIIDTAIVRKNARWGRQYGSFLYKGAVRLDQAFGGILPRESDRYRQTRRIAGAIKLIIAAHPHMSSREIADVLGISHTTANRWLTVLKEQEE